MARLATGIWVSALLHRCDRQAVPVYVLRRGDDMAGAVLVLQARRDGSTALWAQEYDFDADARLWRVVADGPAADIAANAQRQVGRDPDLWLIEVESDSAPELD